MGNVGSFGKQAPANRSWEAGIGARVSHVSREAWLGRPCKCQGHSMPPMLTVLWIPNCPCIFVTLTLDTKFWVGWSYRLSSGCFRGQKSKECDLCNFCSWRWSPTTYHTQQTDVGQPAKYKDSSTEGVLLCLWFIYSLYLQRTHKKTNNKSTNSKDLWK